MNIKHAIDVAERCSQLKLLDPLQSTAIALLKEIERLRSEIADLKDTIGCYDDVVPCSGCGEPVETVSEGIALCDKCAEESK